MRRFGDNGAMTRLGFILFALAQLLRVAGLYDRVFRARLGEHDLIAQIRTRDGKVGRVFIFAGGRVRSRSGIHARPDVTLTFDTAELGARLMMPPINWSEQIAAQKNFCLTLDGPDELACWFAQTIVAAARLGWSAGTKENDGSVALYQHDQWRPGLRLCEGWQDHPHHAHRLHRRGRRAPGRSRRAAAASRRRARRRSRRTRSTGNRAVYSPDRLLRPLKRVDFDPSGERNPHNRGVSGYEPISWDAALDIVAGEIKRQKLAHGPSAIAFQTQSHHTWGNVGYYFSALQRFANLVGHTVIASNPDSWEGWYWGASHHWGYTMRMGLGEGYGTVEDLLVNAEMVVFWSSDPESTSGVYAGQEGTIRRQWLKRLGIPVIHIDPYFNESAAYLGGTWIAPRPGTDAALALAIAHVWIAEGLYDREFVAKRTHGFETWQRYITGGDDGVAKTPEWQERETGVPARIVRALARAWGAKRTYLGAGGLGNGFGGACRGPTGVQWARAMVCLAALQGLGRPGVNFGNLQWGAPVDLGFWFPGYAEGGISGDVMNTAAGLGLYQRMPHLMTINTVTQAIPRLHLPEAILEGRAEGWVRDGRSAARQFSRVVYPAPGASRVRMLYRYGGTNFGTLPDSSRFVRMYQSSNLECVVNQSIWMEGEAKFADIVLPACTSFERWDISEWAGVSGYAHHSQMQANHRVVTMQHKCIEPLGESKSDYDIFFALAKRLGLGAYYSEGMTDLDWVKRMFDASDLKRRIGWRRFLKRGYYVVPAPEPARRAPVAFRWFYEGRKKDVPEPLPIAAEYRGEFGAGLGTPTGKFEFECETLKSFDAADEERPPILKYSPSPEGSRAARAALYPLQLLTPHPRFSFHSQGDGKDGFVNDIADHRVKIDGRFYLVLRLSSEDVEGARHRAARSRARP